MGTAQTGSIQPRPQTQKTKPQVTQQTMHQITPKIEQTRHNPNEPIAAKILFAMNVVFILVTSLKGLRQASK